jgi:hypothetical protein
MKQKFTKKHIRSNSNKDYMRILKIIFPLLILSSQACSMNELMAFEKLQIGS